MAALATGAIAALLAVDGGSGGSRAFALESPKPATNPAERALRTGGQLNVMGFRERSPAAHGQSDGWYGLSTVGRSGALRYLVRCPGQVSGGAAGSRVSTGRRTDDGWRFRSPR